MGALSLSATASHRAMSDFAVELERLGDRCSRRCSRSACRAADGGRAHRARARAARRASRRACASSRSPGACGISEATAKTHARNLFRKLDATSRAEAVHAARERGLFA